MAEQYTRSVRVRLRYRFDNLVARGTTVLISWLALACLAFVVPMSLVLVWADRRVPPTASSRLTAVWVSVGQTLKIGGAVGSPLFILASVSLALVALLFVSTLVSLITTGIDRRIMALRLGHSTVLETRHTVVLGWSDQIFLARCSAIDGWVRVATGPGGALAAAATTATLTRSSYRCGRPRELRPTRGFALHLAARGGYRYHFPPRPLRLPVRPRGPAAGGARPRGV